MHGFQLVLWYGRIYLNNSIIIVHDTNRCNTTGAGAIVHLQPDVVLPNENVLTFFVIRKEPRTSGDVRSRRQTLDTGGLAARSHNFSGATCVVIAIHHCQ